MYGYALPFVLLLLLSSAAVSQDSLGGAMSPLSNVTKGAVDHYLYSRVGSDVVVEIFDLGGEPSGRAILRWPEDVGPQIDYTTISGERFAIGLNAGSGIFTFEALDAGQRFEIQRKGNAWIEPATELMLERDGYLGEQEDLLLFLAGLYDDALANLGFANVQRARTRAQINAARNARSTNPDAKRFGDCAEFALCNGPLAVAPENGLTSTSCCSQARATNDVTCSDNHTPETQSLCTEGCCSHTCNAICLIGNALCSCTAESRACGTSVVICDDLVPPMPPECI